jgi:UDPglucose 6-dehydrogenase
MRIRNKHIVIGCTVMPTYCTVVARALIPDCENCTISYNPEFIAQGDIIAGQLRPDMVLIGEGSAEAGALLEQHHRDVVDNEPHVCRLTTASAEICKLSINCFCTTKISYANMVGDICDATPGAEKIATLHAVGLDSRVGNKYLRPGYGFGGPCFPRDNRALAGFAKSVGVDAMVSNVTDAYNVYHTARQADALLAEDKAHYIMHDVAYKPSCPVPIVEESQKLAIAVALASAGKRVTIVDRDFIVAKVCEVYGSLFEYHIVESFEGFDPEQFVPSTALSSVRSAATQSSAREQLHTRSESKA